jgi:serine/threonine protein kinase
MIFNFMVGTWNKKELVLLSLILRASDRSLAAMRNLSMLTPIFYVFFSFSLLSHISSASTSTPPYVAVDDITLNCGTSGYSTDQFSKREWMGDIRSKFTPIEEGDHKSNASTAQRQDSSVNTVPYLHARLSYSQFMYYFHLTPGPKFVRFYFYPVSYSGFEGSQDFFTVKANSFTLLRNFSASIYIHANSLKENYFSKEFCINVEKDQILNLTFIPSGPSPSTSSKFYAFINGIEIVSMPDKLYYGAEDPKNVPQYVDPISPFPINNDMALEKVVRLNVGGGLISAVADTGMFREWSSQNDSSWLSGGVNPHQVTFTPKYTQIENYTAPDDIYWSAVSLGPDTNKNLRSNLTLKLLVDPGFYYLVRLHFCEMVSQITKASQRVFKISIDNKIAEQWADVILWAGRNETPVYKDYVVYIQKKGVEGKSDLFIALLPRVSAYDLADVILNGVEVFKLSDNGKNLAGPNPGSVPYLPLDQQPASTASESKTKKTIIIAIGSGAGFLVVLTLVCCMILWKLRMPKRYASYYPLSKCWCWCWPEPDKGKSTRTRASSLPEELCRHFTLEEIKTATNNFHEELIIGVGGFGNVYKGIIDEGTMTVAIKRLNPESKQGLREFLTEIEMLSLLRHVHLVSLIGFCNEEGEMILVYEYMTNGTLRHHLYETQDDPLSWIQRLKICVGAASGLNYLHTGVKQPIIHRDVKSNNILLDEKWEAKVSDFGLSKMGQDNTAVSTVVKGTWGYLDPDYARRQQLTDKSDVYSFGVVLFEVLCARKALDQKLGTEQCHLANWARKCIERGTIGEIIDPYLNGKIAPESFNVYVGVAESCVRDQVNQRPMMNDVMEKLRFALELQNYADEKINLNCKRSYPEILSFSVVGTIGVPRNNNIYSEHLLETDSTGTGLTTTNNTGLTCPSLNSDITSQDVSTDIT